MKDGQTTTRLLVVDPAAAVRTPLEGLIRRHRLPYLLEVSDSTSAAIRRFAEENFDAMLLDCANIEVDQLELPEDAEAGPVVLLAGPGQEEVVGQVVRQGACPCVVDVTNERALELLPEVVRRVTECRRAKSELRGSEHRYRQMVETANEGVCIMGVDAKIVFVNRNLAEMIGYTVDELLGEPAFRFLFDEDHEMAEEKIRRRREGIRERYEMRVCHKDGSARWVEISASPLLDGREQYAGTLAMVSDVTTRRRSDETLRLSHRFLEIANRHSDKVLLLEHIVAELRETTGCGAVGIRVLDEEGNIPYQAYDGFDPRFYESENALSIKTDQCMCIDVIKGDTDADLAYFTDGGSFYMNATTKFLDSLSKQQRARTRNVCNALGYESVALIPIPVADRIFGLIHVADPHENMVPQHMVETLESIAGQLGSALQRVWAEEELRKARDELENRVEQRTAQLKAINRELEAEIERRREVEKQARQRLDQLAHVDRVSTAGEMVSGLAHELNQPLAAIANFAQACRYRVRVLEGESREEVVDSLGQIVDQADRAGQIIRRLRTFVRRVESHRVPADVNQMVHDVIALLEVDVRLHDIRLKLDLGRRLPEVFVDRIQIEQVITNLIRNAVEATADAPRTDRRVTVRTAGEGADLVRVDVEDNGKGLGPKDFDQLFQPFFTTKPHGLGLGLSISRSIVRAHGGHLDALPGRERGITFRFTLPARGEGEDGEGEDNE